MKSEMKIELDIDARDLAFAKVYADSIGIDTDSLIREILRDWANSVAEQITADSLRAFSLRADRPTA